MSKYNYHLDKTSTKHICPECGKKTFVLYLNEENKPIDSECGRCDREQKCSYHLSPKEYFKNKGIYNNRFNSRTFKKSEPPQRQPEEQKKPFLIHPNRFAESISIPYEKNPLFIALCSLLNPLVDKETIRDTFDLYGVGTSSKYESSTEFFQIDQNGNIRTAKVMAYDTITAKRIKGTLNWIHTEGNKGIWKYDKSEFSNSLPEDFRLEQCFFGSHLIDDSNKDKVIMLFEAEKTALIIASLLYNDPSNIFIPIATGGVGNFNPKKTRLENKWDKHQALKNRYVVLFPDMGKFEEWRTKGMKLYNFCSQLYISSVLEPNHINIFKPKCEINQGEDLADIILKYIAQGKKAEDLVELLLYSYNIDNRLF